MTIKVLSGNEIRVAEQKYFATTNNSSYLVGEVAKCLFKTIEYILNGKINQNTEKIRNSILIVCGKGNNGADGYALANILETKSIAYSVFQVAKPMTIECLEYSNKIPRNRFVSAEDLEANVLNSSIVVDCVFGTGFHGECDDNTAKIISILNEAKMILACDIPSGINSDNGKASKSVIKASYTMAVGALKYGHLLRDGKDCCGELILADVNLPLGDVDAEVYVGEDMAKLFEPRKNNSHKGNYGSLLIVADSNKYIGAGVLAYTAGINTLGECGMSVGTGCCKLSVPESMYSILAKHVVHCSLLPRDEIHFSNPTAIAIGMGLDVSDAELLCNTVTGATCPILIDAEGLNILAKNMEVLNNSQNDIVLTPHVKEFARLTGLAVDEILNNPMELVKSFAKKWGATVLLKGTTTIVSDGERSCLVANGIPALAKGGSGDVLSGIIGGLLARGIEPYLAARAGAFIHAEAAKIAIKDSNEYSLMPMDVARAITSIINNKIVVHDYKIITP